MKVGEAFGWLLFGKPRHDIKDVGDRLDGVLERQREMELEHRTQNGFAEAVMKGHALRMDRLEGADDALRRRVEALETKQEELKGRTLGWQEGFGGEMREALRRMDERIAKMLEPDDSAGFEIKQWVEEMQALRKDVKALEKRVESVERIRPIFISDKEPDPRPRQPWPGWPSPTVTWREPQTSPPEPPFKITCQGRQQEQEAGR